MSALTSLLARDAIVSVDAIEEALQRQVLDGGEIDTALLELGSVDENVLASYRAASFQLEPATRQELMHPSDEALELLPTEVAEELSIVPLRVEGERLLIALAEPPDEARLKELADSIALDLELRVGTEVRIAAALAVHYGIEPSSRLRRLASLLDERSAGELTSVAPSSRLPSQPVAGQEPSETPTLRGVDGPEIPPAAPVPAEARGAERGSEVQVAPVLALGSAASGKAGRAGVRSGFDPHADPNDTQPARPSNMPPPMPDRGSARSPVPSSRAPRVRQSVVPHGPLTREATSELLLEAAGRDDVLEVLFAFARQYFECTVLFSVREGHLLGLEASGLRSALEPRTLDVTFDRASAVNDVVRSQITRVVDLDRAEADAALLESLGRAGSQPAALVPVTIRKRIVALLYGDRDGERFDVAELADLIETLPHVTRAFERIIAEHKVLVMQARRSLLPPPDSVRPRSLVPRGSFSNMPAARSSAPAPQAAGAQGAERGAQQGSKPPGKQHTDAGMHPVTPPTETGLSPRPSAPAADGEGPETPPSSQEPRKRVRLSRVDEPFRRSQIGERLAQDALHSLGVRGAAPPPPGSGTAPEAGLTDEELEGRPTVQLTSTHVLRGGAPAGERSPGSYSHSTRPGPRSAEPDADTRPQRGSQHPPRDDGQPESRPPPRTLSQPPPGAGSYNVREVGTEHVSLIGGKRQRASRPAPARDPVERAAPRNSERPPAPSPIAEERVGRARVDAVNSDSDFPEPMESPEGGAAQSPQAPRPSVRAKAADDPSRTSPARKGAKRADPRRDDDDGQGPPQSEMVSIPPEVSESLLPPAPVEDGGPQEMVIDLAAEASRVVDELARCAPDDEGPHVAALLRLGEPALEALTARFPGGLWFNRNQAHQRMPAGRDVSAIARALYAFEERAAPYIARLLSSSRADVRLYAILLAVERVLPELLWPLSERVFDSDGGVRLLMYENLPLYRHVDGFDEVLKSLRARAADDNEQLPNRLAALEALSVVRDPQSVELLWELSGSGNRQLSVPATRAFTALTGQDFGGSSRKWRAWYGKNRDRHRVQWLIDGLMHGEERVREIAGNELGKLTRIHYGYSPSAPKREREKAKRRYEAWWEGAGKKEFRG